MRFEYLQPGTMKEALALLDQYGSDARILAGGTDLMLKNRGPQKNIDIFLDYFCDSSGMARNQAWERFLSFYHEKFNTLAPVASPAPQARAFLEAAVSSGMTSRTR